MGPPGLWQELRRLGAGRALRGGEVEALLEGRRVAVDAAIWLHEAQRQRDLTRAFGPKRAALKVVFERCSRWLRKGVLPIVVLEGPGGGRKDRVDGRGGKQAGRLSSVLAGPAEEVRQLLAALGIPLVDAEGEAEATCAALARRGACDFVATSDSDALLFGAPAVLTGLDLQAKSSASRAELWELRHMEAVCGLSLEALTATAALAGCDYSAGVRGVGIRGAAAVACRLRGDAPAVAPQVATPRGNGASDAGGELRALGRLLRGVPPPPGLEVPAARLLRCCGCRRCGHGNVRKASHGRRGCDTCATSQGCRPREGVGCSCSGCRAVAELGGRARVSVARLSARVARRAAEEPSSQGSLLGAARQYGRALDPAAESLAGERPAWRGVHEGSAQAALAGVFPRGLVPSKLLPLQLEWVLRCLAAEGPGAPAGGSAEARCAWAADRGFRWAPVSARRERCRAAASRRALVTWAILAPALGGGVASETSTLTQLARLSLAADCGLLVAEESQPSALRRALLEMARDCPEAARRDAAALRRWASCEGRFPFVPRGAEPVQAGRLRTQWRVLWAHTSSGQAADGLVVSVPAKTVDAFGGLLAACLAPQRGPRQRSLLDFLRPDSTAAALGQGDPLGPAAAMVGATTAGHAAGGTLGAPAPATPRRRPACREPETPPKPRRPSRAGAPPAAVGRTVAAAAAAVASAGKAEWQASPSAGLGPLEPAAKRARWAAGVLRSGVQEVLD